MKILFVSHMYPTPENTVYGIFVHQQVQSLAERGHEVRVISPTPYIPNVPYLPDRWARFSNTTDRAHIDGIDVMYPKYLSLPSHRTLPLVSKSVRRTVADAISELQFCGFSPDVINAHVPLPDGYACIRSSRRLNVPMVTTVHGANIHKSSKQLLCRHQIRSVLESSDEIVFNSRVLREKAKKIYAGLEDTNIVPNGVPLERIRSVDPVELPTLFSENRLVLTSLGSLDRKKGQLDVLKAIERLPRHLQPNYLLIGDGSHREKLEQEAKKVDSPIHFTGTVPHETVLSYLMSTDIMALPSTQEAFGVAYIEAMACGSPVIGCQGEGPSDFVRDGETGYLVPPNDPNAIAEKIRYLSENRLKLKRMGDAARDYVRENLTWEENARQIERIYQHSIENS
jgi:glycosyltransferase involved in cell wall biosynthesis